MLLFVLFPLRLTNVNIRSRTLKPHSRSSLSHDVGTLFFGDAPLLSTHRSRSKEEGGRGVRVRGEAAYRISMMRARVPRHMRCRSAAA